MSPGAKILSTKTLIDIKNNLSKLDINLKKAILSNRSEIKQEIIWLEERLKYWQRDVQLSKKALSEARIVYKDCLDSEGADCSSYAEDLRNAQIKLAQSEEELRNVQRWMRKVHETAQIYENNIKNLQALLDEIIPKSKSLLNNKIDLINQYANVEISKFSRLLRQAIFAGANEASLAYGTMVKTIGTATERATLHEHKGVDLDVLRKKLKTPINGSHFPIYDNFTKKGIGSVKFFGIFNELDGIAINRYCNAFYEAIGTSGKVRKFDIAAEALLEAKDNKFIQSEDSEFNNIKSISHMKKYLNNNAILFVPSDHVKAVRNKIKKDLLKSPENFGFGYKFSQSEANTYSVKRIKSVGTTSKNIINVVGQLRN